MNWCTHMFVDLESFSIKLANFYAVINTDFLISTSCNDCILSTISLYVLYKKFCSITFDWDLFAICGGSGLFLTRKCGIIKFSLSFSQCAFNFNQAWQFSTSHFVTASNVLIINFTSIVCQWLLILCYTFFYKNQ